MAKKFSFPASWLGRSWKASTTASLNNSPTLTLTEHSVCQMRGNMGATRGGGINSDKENIDLFLSHRLVTHVCLLVFFHPLWSFYNWWVYSQSIQERLTDRSKRLPGTDTVHCSFFMESFSKSVFYAVLHTMVKGALFLFLHFSLDFLQITFNSTVTKAYKA